MEHAYKEWKNIEQLLGKHEQIVGIDQKESVFLENDQLQVKNRVHHSSLFSDPRHQTDKVSIVLLLMKDYEICKFFAPNKVKTRP